MVKVPSSLAFIAGRTKKQWGVKNLLPKGANPRCVTWPGKGRGAAKLFSQPKSRPQLTHLPSSSEFLFSISLGGEDMEVDTQPLQPPLGS